jgi:hypothetical protein
MRVYLSKDSFHLTIFSMDFWLSALPTTIHPTAFLKNKGLNTVAGSELPAMSQSCTLNFVPLTLMIFRTKSIEDCAVGVRFLVNTDYFVPISNSSQLKKDVIKADLPV